MKRLLLKHLIQLKIWRNKNKTRRSLFPSGCSYFYDNIRVNQLVISSVMVYHLFNAVFTIPRIVNQTHLIKFQLEQLVWFLFFPLIYIVNDQLFDKLVRKPYERQQYHPKFISNMKFTEIIIKHGLIDSSIMYIAVFDE